MTVALPSEMARKLSVVRRKHNRAALTGCLVLIPPLFLYLQFGPRSQTLLYGFLAVFAILCGIYFRWIWIYDTKLCEEVGLLCPHCSRPLYQGGANEFTLAGRCPKCKCSVLTPASDASEQKS